MYISSVISTIEMPVASGSILGFWVILCVPFCRFLVFEVVYLNTAYITPRQDRKWKDLCFTDMYPPVMMLTYVLIGQYYIGDIKIQTQSITMFELGYCILAFFCVDFAFYFTHRLMHVPILYRILGHKQHHVLTKPTAYDNIENFSLVDGLTHILAFDRGIRFLSYGVTVWTNRPSLSTNLWFLVFAQWIIVGELQHGGKSLSVETIPLLELSRKILRCKSNLCSLHDMHHRSFTTHYSMTGLPDKLFGTNAIA